MHSRLPVLFLFALLSGLAVSLNTFQGTLAGGASGDITPGATWTFYLGLAGTAPYVTVSTNGDTHITVSAFLAGGLDVALPDEGIASIAFQTYAGVEIASSNTTAELWLTLTTPDFSSLFTASTQFSGLFTFDASTSAYVMIPSTVANGQLTATLPGVGQYAFVKVDKSVTVDYSVPNGILAGVNRTYQWADNLAIKVETNTARTITVVKQTNVTVQGTVEQRAALGTDLGIYFDIELSASGAHVSTLQYTYSDALLEAHGLAAAAANRLRWAYYDTVHSVWTFADAAGASVDLNAQVVVQVTNHFSSWGVYAADSAASHISSLMWCALLASAVMRLL